MKTAIQQLKKDKTRKTVFTFLLVLIAASFVLYGFGIASTTVSIAEANTYNRDINDLQTEIAELEIEYFEMVNTLSLEQAQRYGFTETSQVHYARIDEVKAVAYHL